MTFRTLAYIHKLLSDDMERKQCLYKWTLERCEEYDNDTIASLKADYEEVYAALQEFKTHDFR